MLYLHLQSPIKSGQLEDRDLSPGSPGLLKSSVVPDTPKGEGGLVVENNYWRMNVFVIGRIRPLEGRNAVGSRFECLCVPTFSIVTGFEGIHTQPVSTPRGLTRWLRIEL